MDGMPSREQYAVLRQWSPLLEQLAYKSSARILNLIDSLRPEIIKHLTAGAQGNRSTVVCLLVRAPRRRAPHIARFRTRSATVVNRYGKPVQMDNVDANFSVAARTNSMARGMRRALGRRIRRACYRTIPGHAFESRTSDEGVRRAFRA